MTGDGAVLNLCGPLANGDGIDDLTLGVPCSSSVHGPTDEWLRSKMLNQLLFQHSSSLDEQTAIEGLVGHAHALVAGIASLQPTGNLLRRPVLDQFTGDDQPQLPVPGKPAGLGSQGGLPSLMITGSIHWTAAVACHLPTYRRRSSTEPCGYLTKRRAGNYPS